VTQRRILALTEYYLPGFKGGGCLRAVANIAGHLRGDFSFTVLTSSRDLGESRPYSAEAMARTRQEQACDIRYVERGMRGQLAIRRVLREPWDLVYLNSALSPRFSIWPLILRRLGRLGRVPFLLAPRGELMAGALQQKATKKSAFLSVARKTAHFSQVAFHVTSSLEAAELEKLELGQGRIVLAPDLPPLAFGNGKVMPRSKAPGALKAVFLSRIDTKKNLLFALQALKESRTPVDFDIFGPIVDDAYWRSCQAVIPSLPPHVRVQYLGAVSHDQVHSVFSSHDLFLFPTSAENNGYVVLEALASGCPVLVSDQTPWRGLEALGVGRDLPLGSVAGFTRAIEAFGAMTPGEHGAMSARARAYGLSKLSAPADIAATRKMFEEAMA
jgi:glycosyltransferase involved in cell wall biosynthesis